MIPDQVPGIIRISQPESRVIGLPVESQESFRVFRRHPINRDLNVRVMSVVRVADRIGPRVVRDAIRAAVC